MRYLVKQLKGTKAVRVGWVQGRARPSPTARGTRWPCSLATLRTPEPWTPGHCQDVAMRVGPFIERAHTRPDDDHGPDRIAVALQHPGGSYAPYSARYRKVGWLRCETSEILGVLDPAYTPLTHDAAGLDLPAGVGMTPANYGVHVEAREFDGTGYTLLRLGPCTQARHADRDGVRLNAQRAVGAPLDVSDHAAYNDSYEADALALLAAAVEGVSAA